MVLFTEDTVRQLSAGFKAKDAERFHGIMRETLSPAFAKRYPHSGNGVPFNWRAVVYGKHPVIPFHLMDLTIRMDEYDLMFLFVEHYGAFCLLSENQKHYLLQTALDLHREPRWVNLLEGLIFPKKHGREYVMKAIENNDVEVLKLLLDGDCAWDAESEARARELGRQEILDFVTKRKEELKLRTGCWPGPRGVRGHGLRDDPFEQK